MHSSAERKILRVRSRQNHLIPQSDENKERDGHEVGAAEAVFVIVAAGCRIIR